MILVDAGPLVALVDKNDQHHSYCRTAARKLHEPVGTTWPAVTEAVYLLSDLPKCQDAVWDMLVMGEVQLLDLTRDDVPRIRELMRKYSDLPMDLADASLIRVAELEKICKIFTTDRRDFAVYRLYGRIRPTVIP